MTIWDFRQQLESLIPWWVPFAITGIVILGACVSYLRNRNK